MSSNQPKPEIAPSSFQSLTNQLLIAMPELTGSSFANSVIYICDHSSKGAMGLVINNPLEISASQVFNQLSIELADPKARSARIFYGGPVSNEHGFVLHSKSGQSWNSTLDITPQISLTTSKDIIEDLAQGNGPSQSLIILGCSGWGPGQLENEISQNAWLTVPAEPGLLFETPRTECAIQAAAKAGIDLTRISSSFGHA